MRRLTKWDAELLSEITTYGVWVVGVPLSHRHGMHILLRLWAWNLNCNMHEQFGYRDVSCVLDCANLVEVMQSTIDTSTYWARDVIDRVTIMLSWGWNVTIDYVPKKENSNVDCLARQASREGTPRNVWRLPPSFVIESIYLDALV